MRKGQSLTNTFKMRKRNHVVIRNYAELAQDVEEKRNTEYCGQSRCEQNCSNSNTETKILT